MKMNDFFFNDYQRKGEKQILCLSVVILFPFFFFLKSSMKTLQTCKSPKHGRSFLS